MPSTNGVLKNGTAADDVLKGSAGDASLAGRGGDDTVSGGAGSDLLQGNHGADTLNGGAGADLVLGGAGADIVNGGAGDDHLQGGAGNDVIYGGAGNDLIDAGTGADVLNGGAGNDTIRTGADPYTDTVIMSKGNDTINASGPVLLDVSSLTATGAAANKPVAVSTSGNTATITVGEGRNGESGTTINNPSWTSILTGVSGLEIPNATDAFQLHWSSIWHWAGDVGTDAGEVAEDAAPLLLLADNPGNDTYQLNHSSGVVSINDTTGQNTTDLGSSSGIVMFDYGSASNGVTADLRTQSFTDATDSTNSMTYSTEAAGPRADNAPAVVVRGSSGDDSYHGDAADNLVIASGGNDMLNGGAGQDTVSFLTGIWPDPAEFVGDSAVSSDASGAASMGTAMPLLPPLHSADVDLKQGQAAMSSADKNATSTLKNFENVIGTLGDDSIAGDGGANTLVGATGNDNLSGRGGDDALNGGAGSDTLIGNTGADTLKGKVGDDTLRGGRGDDNLKGGAGNDVLNGGAGTNTLTGGAGEDTFVFTDNSGATTIRDFDGNADTVDLSGVSGIDSYDDLITNHLIKSGGDTLLSRDNGSTVTFEDWTGWSNNPDSNAFPSLHFDLG